MDKFVTLEGDCLLTSAIIIYLGQMTAEFRTHYARRWQRQCESSKRTRISAYYNLIKLFGDQLQIKRWIQQKLPSDTYSIQNAIIYDLTPI